MPHRDGGGGGPGFFLHHHHVSLGARFPSPACVRLGQAETTTAGPGQQPSQSTAPGLKSHGRLTDLGQMRDYSHLALAHSM